MIIGVCNLRGGLVLLGICLIALIPFGNVRGEDAAKVESKQDYQVFDLGEIYVTSDKPPAVQEMAITTEITAEDIKATNSRTVGEALTYVPGVQISIGKKNQALMQIHGLDQTRVLVLIDGVPYYETKYGFLDLNEIPVDSIARIEVTKGAASVLYGPNAFMGVVNIITKKPTEKPSAEATFEIGPYATHKESVSNGMKVGIFSYWLNYSHQQSDGFRLSDNFSPQVATIVKKPGGTTHAILQEDGYRVNSYYKTNSFWAKVGIDPNPDSEYYLNLHYINREKGDSPSIYGGTIFPSSPAFSNAFDKIPKYNDLALDFSGQQKIFDQLTLKGKFFYHNHLDDYESYLDRYYSDKIALSEYKDYNLGGSLVADIRPVAWDIVRIALNVRGDSHKQYDDVWEPFAGTFSYTGSVGLENEFNLVKNLSIVAGLSRDRFKVTKAQMQGNGKNGTKYYTIYNAYITNPSKEYAVKPDVMDAWEPMIGANYDLTGATRLFGSIARKIHFPTLNELFSSKGGNIKLKPEKTVNYTLGVSQLFSKYAKAELSGFYHNISDFIGMDTNPITNPSGKYENTAKVAMLGYELHGEIYPVDNLTLLLGYTYNDAVDKSQTRVTRYVVNIPEHQIDAGIRYLIPSINTSFNLQGLYLARVFSQLPTPQYPTNAVQTVQNYYIVNARVSYSFLKYFETYLAVNNLFDKNYQSSYGYPAPGRNFWVGISAKY